MAAEKRYLSFLSSDKKTQINAVSWTPEGDIKGYVQILHGVSEHIERYDAFAKRLAENGFCVYGHDHLGHGKSVSDDVPKGFFAEENGWDMITDDAFLMFNIMKNAAGDMPCFIFGHSMGSFVLRTFASKYPNAGASGMIICGTGGMSPMLLKIGMGIAKGEVKKHGAKTPSQKLNDLAFGGYNKKIKDAKTPFDWISKNEDNMASYLKDENCGFLCTAGLFYDMMSGLDFIGDKKNIANINKDIPYLFVAGEDDPVGAYGKGVQNAAAAYKKAGAKDVSVILYKDARHEILNEDIKDTVIADVLGFLKQKI